MSKREVIRLFGPAWIALLADADAASIIGGLITGKQYGLGLIWFVLLLALPLFIVQEAAGRISAITGKSLGEIIRTHYSKKIAILATFPIFSIDVFTYISEYIGIALGSYLIGIPPFIGLITFFILHLLVIVTKNYEKTEKTLILISFLLILSSIVAIIPKTPQLHLTFYLSTSNNFLTYLAINIGAVVTPPCMLIYQSSATSLKYSRVNEITVKDKLSWITRETALGALSTELVIVFAEAIGTGLNNIDPTNTFQLSSVLRSVFSVLPMIFGILIISAGFLALIVVSLSSAWGVLEALGKNNHIRNLLKIYSLESIPAILVVYLYSYNYSEVLQFATTLLALAPIVFTVIAIILGILVSNRNIMREHAYSKFRIFIYFLTVTLIFIGGIIGVISIT